MQLPTNEYKQSTQFFATEEPQIPYSPLGTFAQWIVNFCIISGFSLCLATPQGTKSVSKRFF